MTLGDEQVPLSDPKKARDIFDTLAHHDSRLGELNQRITGVEVSLVSLDKKFDVNNHETSIVLKDIQKSVAHTQSKQGPGFMQIAYGCAAVAGILTAVSTGITMLVGSQFSGPMTAVQTQLGALVEAKKDADQQDAQELRDLKNARRSENDKFKSDIADRLRELEAHGGWVPKVTLSRR